MADLNVLVHEKQTALVTPTTGQHAYFDALRSTYPILYQYSMRNQTGDADKDASEAGTSRAYSSDPIYQYYTAGDEWMTLTIPQGRSDPPLGSGYYEPDLTCGWAGGDPTPIPSKATQKLLITWDAWWATEFTDKTKLDPLSTHKAWHLMSNFSGAHEWCGIVVSYAGEAYTGNEVARIGIHHLQSDNQYGLSSSRGLAVDGALTAVNTIEPRTNADWWIQGATATRFWILLEILQEPPLSPSPLPAGGIPEAWSRLSMWAADETRDPVQFYDRLAINLSMHTDWTHGRVWNFRQYFDTSAAARVNDAAHPALTIKIRNFLALDVSALSNATVETLLEKPVGTP